MSRWASEWVGRWVGGRAGGRIDGWMMDEWTDGRMGGWMGYGLSVRRGQPRSHIQPLWEPQCPCLECVHTMTRPLSPQVTGWIQGAQGRAERQGRPSPAGAQRYRRSELQGPWNHQGRKQEAHSDWPRPRRRSPAPGTGSENRAAPAARPARCPHGHGGSGMPRRPGTR